jgi:O-antigen/teichoic acid export membrane protein
MHSTKNKLGGFVTGKLRSNFARRAVFSIILKCAYTVLGFAISIVMARHLGVSSYGTYSYVFSLLTLLSTPAQFGLPNLIVRETAKNLATGRVGLVKGIWRWSGLATGTLALAIAIIASGILWFGKSSWTPEFVATFAWGLLLIPLSALADLRGAALRGLHRVVQGQLPEMVLKPGFHFIFLLGFIVLVSTEKLSASTTMALNVLASALAFGIGAWLLWRSTPQEVREATPSYQPKQWLSSSLPLALSNGMQLINRYTDIVVLGIFMTSADVGVYRVAAQVSLLVAFLLQSVNMVVTPQFSRLYAKGDMVELQRLVTKGSRLIFFGTLPVIAFLVFFGKPFLVKTFGDEFAAAYPPLLILILGQLVNASTGSVASLLNMTGHERETAFGMAVGAVGNLVLNFVFIPFLGINGSALATAITYTLWNVLLCYSVYKNLGINSTAFTWKGFRGKYG